MTNPVKPCQLEPPARPEPHCHWHWHWHWHTVSIVVSVAYVHHSPWTFARSHITLRRTHMDLPERPLADSESELS